MRGARAGAWAIVGRKRQHQAVTANRFRRSDRRRRWQLQLLPLFFVWACVACHPRENPQAAYDHARAAFVHGDLVACQKEAEKGFERFYHYNDEWAWRFKILEAEALLWEGGQYPQVVRELAIVPTNLTDANSAIRRLIIESVADGRIGDHSKAAQELNQADRLCVESSEIACGELLRARGSVAAQRGDLEAAEANFRQTLAFARSHKDSFLEANALLNIGEIFSRTRRFDEAADWSEAGYRASTNINALDLSQTALGNLGVMYYNLGDSERALENFLSAEKDAAQLGDSIDELIWLRHAGRIYADRHDTNQAARAFEHAMRLAEKSGESFEIYSALRSMSWLALQNGNLNDATSYADQALQNAKNRHDHEDELYPILIQGQIAARTGDSARAQQLFELVEGDRESPPLLKWEAQHSLARLFEDQNRIADADRAYRTAISTFEGARDTVVHEELRLPFLANGAGIYDDYVHFLIEQHKTEEALLWADYSRARALAEGLGLAKSERTAAAGSLHPPQLVARSVAAHLQAAVLYYWMGEKRSYLWAVTANEVKLFPLPAKQEIEAAVQRYRKALTGPVDVLASRNEDGQKLYRNLIQPAERLLPKGVRVIVIPDGNLNNLNFETLIAPDPEPHYWIEDAVIANASSLRVLEASARRRTSHNPRTLLLIGNSLAPNDQYPALPQAAAQMQSIGEHFPAQKEIISGAQATPSSYAASHPENFSHIHFVAHGTASRLSPLDSAIILSQEPADRTAFKLYARDIIAHPLHAELVTISACYGAGARAYSGEGLVGLAWAFVRAGSHNVIAALWEATDTSTERLMDRFYDELNQGSTPAEALHAAKLSLLHGGNFSNPYYWAPFQLYSGS